MASTTQITVNLSAGLKASSGYGLAQTGVYAYAVYFESKITTPDAEYPTAQNPYQPSHNGGAPAVAANGQYTTYYYTLVDNGVVQNGGTTNIALPLNNSTDNTQFISGKVYFIIQSGQPYGDLFTMSNTNFVINEESDLNWDNATSNNYRFDSVELNVDNSSYDVANLTSVNGYGLPMAISSGIGDDIRTYSIKAGTASDDTTLFGKIAAASSSPGTTQNILYANSDNTWINQNSPLHGDQRMMLSPAEALAENVNAFTANQWDGYVNSLKNNAVANQIVLSNWFNGAPDSYGVWHNAGFFSYQLSWDGTNFWLNPTASSQIQGSIKISPTDLANSIYATKGNFEVWSAQSGGTEFAQPTQSENTGANSQWGSVFVSALTGFTAGYYGATAKSVNGALSGNIDLSKSWNWDPTYAFGNPTVSSGAGDVTPSANVFYDKYSQAFFGYTNSYGGGYSDALMKAFPTGGPLMTLWNGSTDVPTLTVDLFADDETPPQTDYVTPRMYNYIAANGGGYAALTNFTGSASNHFTISLANSAVAIKDDTDITLGFYNGSGGFTTIALPDGQSIYKSWTLLSNLTWAGSPSAITDSKSIVITGIPVMSEADLTAGKNVAWYQLTVGSGDHAKTFNIYVEVDAATYQYKWTPNAQAMSATAQMDGLGFITGQTTNGPTNALTLNVAGASGVAIDSEYWTQITESTIIGQSGNAAFPKAYAPVIGTLDGDGDFTNLSGFTPFANTKANVNPGWVMPTAPTTKQGELAFGWNGSDTVYAVPESTPDTSKVYGYTNKIAALNAAVVSVAGTGGTVGNWVPVTATADLDGRWTTGGVQLGNGTFQVTMTEYRPDDLVTPVNKTSQFQTFTVSMDDLLLATATATIGGVSRQGLEIDNTGHASTPGNWIRLTTTASTLGNATLVAYATNDSGDMLDRDGAVTTVWQEAALARIGSVKSDGGSAMFSGAQSVYMPVTDYQMHFGIVSGNGTFTQTPAVSITGTGGSSAYDVEITGSGGAVTLTAQIIAGNALGTGAVTAAAQRNDDTAWLYLTKGATVDVDTQWSSGYVNTLRFVKIDIDATTGAWSVGGVAYGNTAEFRTAVRDNWDSGFSGSHGNGTGSDTSATWTVAGDTGYYAPVLVNGADQLFIIDNGTATANQDSATHIRMYGENIFGFEDKIGGDWDYNDMVMKLAIT